MKNSFNAFPWLAALVATALATPLAVHGQALPGGALPGQIERQFEPGPSLPSVPRQIDLPSPEPLRIPPGAEQQTVTLREVRLEGATAIPLAELESIWQPSIGKQVSVADLYRMAERATAVYRNRGFVLSRVVLPAGERMDPANAVVRFRAVEGFIEKASIEGTLVGPQGRIQAVLDRIVASRPLNVAALERYLLLINDLSGVTAQAVLSPAASGAFGAADLKLFVGQRAVNGSAELNNRGSRALGPQRLEADLLVNSAFGGFSQFRLSGASTLNRELNFVSTSVDVPIGLEGAVLSVGGSASRGRPDPAQSFGVAFESESLAGFARMSHPVIRSRTQNLYVRGTLTALNGTTDANGVQLSQDRIRALRLGGSYDWADRGLGVNLVDLEVSQGLDAFGASDRGSPTLSSPTGRPDFSKFNVFASRLQGLSDRWSVLVAFQGQKAFTDLLIAERFGFGGSVFGRGYNFSELIGDDGVAGKLELRYDAGGVGWLGSIAPYGFYDAGRVWRRNPVLQEKTDSATSVGFGVRVVALRNLTGLLEVAKPLTRDVAEEGNRDIRVFGAIRWVF